MVDPPARLFAPVTVIRVFRAERTAARTLRQRARRTVPDSPYSSQAVPVRRSKTSM
jgi:hypothetical protein